MRHFVRGASVFTFGLMFVTVARCGTFTYSPGSWSSFTGSASSESSLFSANNDLSGAVPSLTLLSSAASPDNTLGGAFSFTVTWTPATGDTPPTYATVTFHRETVLTVQGSGLSEVLDGITVLSEMDSTNNYLTGVTNFLTDDIMYTLTLTEQSNGTYTATGQILSDTLTSDFDTEGSTVTSCQELFCYAGTSGSN
jgi:hypothetical protein